MRKKIVTQALRLQLLAVLVTALAALVASGCGDGGGEQRRAEARPLPEEGQALRPGEYRSEVFEPRSPSGSARAGPTCRPRCTTP